MHLLVNNRPLGSVTSRRYSVHKFMKHTSCQNTVQSNNILLLPKNCLMFGNNMRKGFNYFLSPTPPSFLDDNSNQSSIADSSPLKQETSNNTSPTPEPMATAQSDSGDTKSEQFPSKQPSSGQDSKTGWSLIIPSRFLTTPSTMRDWQHINHLANLAGGFFFISTS